MKAIKAMLIVLFSVLGISSVKAADVPINLIINAGGMEWAYVSPCAATGGCGNTLIMHDGWELATASDFLAAFTSLSDIVNQFQPNNLCASGYFNSGYSHCDYSDVTSGYLWNAPVAWSNLGNNGFSETFVVRQLNQVSEPGTLAILALGLVGMAAARRRAMK
jgi:hypothetical protein